MDVGENMKILHHTIVFAATLFYGSVAVANTIGIDFTTPEVQRNNSLNTWTLGFAFTANTNLTLTELGFFDSNKDGLSESHQVGLFNNEGDLLTSGTVESNHYLDGWFRWVDVSDVNLIADEEYIVMGVAGSELYAADQLISNMIVDSNITFENSMYSRTNSLTSGRFLSNQGFFGGNIKTIPDNSNISNVPVPASVWLFGSALLGFVGIKKKR